MSKLDYAIPSLFRFEETSAAAAVDAPGIRINAASVEHDGDVLRFDLHVTCMFSRFYAASFHKITHGLVVSLEDADGGRAAVMRAIDPHKRYPRLQGPNYKGGYVKETAPTSFSTRWIVIPFEVPIVRRAVYPTFFVTTFLHDHVSNTLGINLWDASVTSYSRGVESEILLGEGEDDEPEDDDDEGGDEDSVASPKAPEPQRGWGAGMSLQASAPVVGPGEPVWFEGSISVTPAELKKGGADGWLRSIFVCSTREDTQASKIVHWLGERVVFPGDMALYGAGAESLYGTSFRFELGSLLGMRVPPGVHYVQLSARHHRSNVVAVRCG